MKNFIQPGKNIEMEAASAVTSGSVVVFGDLVGVAMGDAASGEKCSLVLEGVFELAKEAAAISAGDKVHFHAASGKVKAASGTGTVPMGYAVASALAGDETVKVLLHKF